MLIHTFLKKFIWKYDMNFLFFERIVCMHENKLFSFLFLYIYSFNILEKNGYFNTEFVSLQYCHNPIFE